MLASLLGTELFMKLAKIKRIKIKMPDGVPPAVTTSFNSLIPETVVILIFCDFCICSESIGWPRFSKFD